MCLFSSEDYSGLPCWLRVGESVQIRPSYSSGIVTFLGRTEFAGGLWVGIELDAPTGNLRQTTFKDYHCYQLLG